MHETASSDVADVVTGEPYTAEDFDAARELVEYGNRVGAVCVSMRAPGGRWSRPKVVHRFAPLRQPSLPPVAAPATRTAPRSRERRAASRAHGPRAPSDSE